MKTILIRTAVGALILVQVVSIMLLIDQKKTAKAQCIPISSTIACNASFNFNASDGSSCGPVAVACSGGLMTWITYTGGSCGSPSGGT